MTEVIVHEMVQMAGKLGHDELAVFIIFNFFHLYSVPLLADLIMNNFFLISESQKTIAVNAFNEFRAKTRCI